MTRWRYLPGREAAAERRRGKTHQSTPTNPEAEAGRVPSREQTDDMARVKNQQPKRGPEFRAQVVAEAKASTIDEAARRHKVSRRSVQRWTKEARDDAEMAQTVARKTALIEQDWADTAKAAMRELLGSLVATVRKAQTEDGPVPGGRIHEMAGAVKVVGELGVAKEMFGAAVVVTDGRPAEDDRKDAAPGEGAAVVPIRPAGVRSSS